MFSGSLSLKRRRLSEGVETRFGVAGAIVFCNRLTPLSNPSKIEVFSRCSRSEKRQINLGFGDQILAKIYEELRVNDCEKID